MHFFGGRIVGAQTFGAPISQARLFGMPLSRAHAVLADGKYDATRDRL